MLNQTNETSHQYTSIFGTLPRARIARAQTGASHQYDYVNDNDRQQTQIDAINNVIDNNLVVPSKPIKYSSTPNLMKIGLTSSVHPELTSTKPVVSKHNLSSTRNGIVSTKEKKKKLPSHSKSSSMAVEGSLIKRWIYGIYTTAIDMIYACA